MSLFIPITKIDVAKQLVYGTLSEETPDKTGEILDYASSKPAFQEWSQQFHAASGGKSVGNVRAMHGSVAAGKLTDIDFDDVGKRITGVAKIVDAEEWQKVLEGVYTGFSIGGGYARRWRDAENPALMRYTPVLTEVSLVDNPAVPTATFDVIKQDGTVECRKFNANPQGGQVSKVMDDGQEHIDTLLAELDWLAQGITGEGEKARIMPHIVAMQHYLANEENEYIDQKNEKMVKFADFEQSVRDTIATLQKRIQQLEEQPLPAKGVVRAVGKSDYYLSVDDTKNTASPSIHELMKVALSNPVAL